MRLDYGLHMQIARKMCFYLSSYNESPFKLIGIKETRGGTSCIGDNANLIDSRQMQFICSYVTA